MDEEEIQKADIILLMLEGQTKELLRGIGLAREQIRKVLNYEPPFTAPTDIKIGDRWDNLDEGHQFYRYEGSEDKKTWIGLTGWLPRNIVIHFEVFIDDPRIHYKYWRLHTTDDPNKALVGVSNQ